MGDSLPLYVTLCFSLFAFRVLSISLTFAILITICLGVGLIWFILFGTLCASCFGYLFLSSGLGILQP